MDQHRSTITIDRLMRPLGAFEQVIDLYAHRNPVQFTLAAELDRRLTADALRDGLGDLQRAHPLLGAEIQRTTDPEAGTTAASFHRSDDPVPLRVADASTWEREAAAEQTTPIPPRPGPLVSAVLVQDADGARSTVLLTFSHQIADGKGALRALQDLVAILDGATVPEQGTPASQESRLASLPEPAPESAAVVEAEPAVDADAGEPAQLRPFDGTTPLLEPRSLEATETRALVERARAESCTVQAALCAAAALALLRVDGRDRVRVNVPIDLRPVIGGDDDVAVRFGATIVTLEPGSAGFWDLARTASAQLRSARRTAPAGAAALAGAGVATPEAAEGAMLAATAADLEITNLGVASTPTTSVRAVWGPTMTTGVEGEQIVGVVTQAGSLRMVNTTRSPVGGLMDQIRAELLATLDSEGAIGR